MNILTGFAIINDTIGKKIAYTHSEVDESGNIIKSNIKQSFAVIDGDLLNAITIIENNIKERIK